MNNVDGSLNLIYEKLLEAYSYQGWWPFLDHKSTYHPKDYDFPKNKNQVFEVILGSILAQNTHWSSVELALNNLNELVDFTPDSFLKFVVENENEFKDAIRCASFVNQKTDYIKNVSEFYVNIEDEIPLRRDLLSVKGIGNETADSILLFAHKQKEFKVDAYTKRIFSYLGYIKEKDSYFSVKTFFELNFIGDVNMFQEYHALIVEHAKRYYSIKPYGENDKLLIEFKIND